MIDYLLNPPLEAAEVAALYDSAGLRRPTQDLARIGRMLSHANLVIAARQRQDGRLVGLSRALTDFSYCCYLSDLAVHAEHQHRGIGRELVARTRAEIGEEVALILLSAPGAMAYYPRIGFEPIDNGFIVRRCR